VLETSKRCAAGKVAPLWQIRNMRGACAETLGTSHARIRIGEVSMLYWAAVFFIIALIAAVFGFTGIAVSAAGAAKILFVIFLVLAAISVVLGRRIPD
jgi:uncharacterized membrane protein YtjA (UPF0391 family)